MMSGPFLNFSRLLAVFAVMITGSAMAQDSEARKADAVVFVEALVGDLASAANNEVLSEDDRQGALREILRNQLAVDPIRQFLFAGAPNDLATDPQRADYDELFPSYIAASFAEQIGELAERRIDVSGAIARGETEAIVQSRLFDAAGRDRATIDWRVRWIDTEPRLLDVMVERVSPLVTKRQEFSALAQREGVDALLTHMRDVVETMPVEE